MVLPVLNDPFFGDNNTRDTRSHKFVSVCGFAVFQFDQLFGQEKNSQLKFNRYRESLLRHLNSQYKSKTFISECGRVSPKKQNTM